MSIPDPNPSPETQYSCLYFGFASNLSPRTMKQRCPSALYCGLAVLPGYKFSIGELGFGNIIPSTDPTDLVFGSLHFLSGRDEAALDKSEEVPDWHSKVRLKVRRVGGAEEAMSMWEGRGKEGIQGDVEVTTYVDEKRKGMGPISKDYIVWLRKAVEDGERAGVPAQYFDRYFRVGLPVDETVGKEEQIVMIRTQQIHREDLRNVPSWMLKNNDQEGV